MRVENEERRPVGNESGAETSAKKSFPTVSATKDIRSLSQRRDFYVRVYSQRRDGIVSVQVFADLRSAERKVDRVRASGLAARMELIRVLAVTPLDDDGVIA